METAVTWAQWVLLLVVAAPILVYLYARIAGHAWWTSKAEADKAAYADLLNSVNNTKEDLDG